jgi:luciferase family oxidoreductase group 1
MKPLSVLDLTPIKQGGDVVATLHESLKLAQHVEALGYARYWVVEHHNTPSVASSATSIVMAYIAMGTKTIRVGAGGIMLPNHSPCVVAEQFGTLAAHFPGRIVLGLGRGIKSDDATMRALRRVPGDEQQFPGNLMELLHYLGIPAAGSPAAPVRAIPGEGSAVPVWILGSSVGGAQLAASLGLPFAYASHFAPDDVGKALMVYRSQCVPSTHLPKPHVMLSVSVAAADTDEEGRFLHSSAQQATIEPLPPPVENYESAIDPKRLALLRHFFRFSLVGSRETVARGLAAFVSLYNPDEIIATSQIFDSEARRKSFDILSEVNRAL